MNHVELSKAHSRAHSLFVYDKTHPGGEGRYTVHPEVIHWRKKKKKKPPDTQKYSTKHVQKSVRK